MTEKFSLFGVSNLPIRSRKRRDRVAKAGRAVFISISLICALILATMVTRIYSEAYVPETETEVIGIEENKAVSETVKSWNVETWNDDWVLDDPKRDRSNVTLRAEWTEVKFEAYNDDGILRDDDGNPIYFDRSRDIQRYLCDKGLMSNSYAPYDSWNPSFLLPWNERTPVTFDPLEDERVDIFVRDVAPTPRLGDFWIDTSDDYAQYVWKGLRWEPVTSETDFTTAIAQIYPFVGEDRHPVWNNDKLWIYHSSVEPIFKSNGDIWIDTDISNEMDVVHVYNYSLWQENRYTTGWGWENFSRSEIPEPILNPSSVLADMQPEFCTPAEVAQFILENGLTGLYDVNELSHSGGYDFRVVSGTSKNIHADLSITLTSGCSQCNRITLELTSSGEYLRDGEIVDSIILHPAQVGQSGLGVLALEHRMNYTVIFSQIGGPPSDARESSYKEVGEFILGPFESWFNSRIIDDGDQDNDGIRDWCDSDIDGDNLLNPIIGGDAQCPNSPVIGYEGWMIDENFDGIHDQVTDDDIDNDGIKNLIDGQGHNVGALWSKFSHVQLNSSLTSSETLSHYMGINLESCEQSPSSEQCSIDDAALSELLEIWNHVISAEDRMCDETYKDDYPERAEADCLRAKEFNKNPPTHAENWCHESRLLLQPQVWSGFCGLPASYESGFDSYEDPFPIEEIIAFSLLIISTLAMIRPGTIVSTFRKLLTRLDSRFGFDDKEISGWSYIIYSSELIGRIVSLVLRVVVLLFGIFIISSTISSELYLIFILFLLTIGISITLLSSLGVIASIWSIWSLRPEEGVRPSEGFTEGTSLIVTITCYFVAIGWVFNSGFIIGSICLLMAASAFKRLIQGASQLTRSTDINEDRVKRVVMGRDGWILVASVVTIIAFFTIPFEIVNSFVVSNYPSQQPYRAGLRAAFWGSVYVVGYTMLFAIPVSIGGAIWLEEYAPKNFWQSAIQTLVTNLAGVPAVVFGLFGLALCSSSSGFGLGLGGTILTAGITMATMAMPTIVISSQEALRAVPPSLRQGAFGVGCTKWQVIKDHVLPHAMPGMMTGTILAMSRIMGEAAPLILVGAVTSVFQEPDPFYYVDYTVLPTLDGFISWVPGLEVALTELPMWSDRPIMTADPTSFTNWGSNPSGKYTVLPVQVYTWTDQPEEGFKVAAAGASLVLLGTLVMVNSVAILVRAHYRKFSNA